MWGAKKGRVSMDFKYPFSCSHPEPIPTNALILERCRNELSALNQKWKEQKYEYSERIQDQIK